MMSERAIARLEKIGKICSKKVLIANVPLGSVGYCGLTGSSSERKIRGRGYFRFRYFRFSYVFGTIS